MRPLRGHERGSKLKTVTWTRSVRSVRYDAERRNEIAKGANRGKDAAATQGLREGLMKTWRAVIIALLGLLAAGCRSDPSRDLLERDNFNKEQQIYQLKCRVRGPGVATWRRRGVALSARSHASRRAGRTVARTGPARSGPGVHSARPRGVAAAGAGRAVVADFAGRRGPVDARPRLAPCARRRGAAADAAGQFILLAAVRGLSRFSRVTGVPPRGSRSRKWDCPLRTG